MAVALYKYKFSETGPRPARALVQGQFAGMVKTGITLGYWLVCRLPDI
jgi:hypothetical protein